MKELDLTLAKFGNERYEIAKRNEMARNYSALKRRQRERKIREIKNNITTTVVLFALFIGTPLLMFLHWLAFGY